MLDKKTIEYVKEHKELITKEILLFNFLANKKIFLQFLYNIKTL